MHKRKNTFILDLSKAESADDIHGIIKKTFGFPEYYGSNWDAFGDCLTDLASAPLHIKIIGFRHMKDSFPRDAAILCEVLSDVKNSCGRDYSAITVEFADEKPETAIPQNKI